MVRVSCQNGGGGGSWIGDLKQDFSFRLGGPRTGRPNFVDPTPTDRMPPIKKLGWLLGYFLFFPPFLREGLGGVRGEGNISKIRGKKGERGEGGEGEIQEKWSGGTFGGRVLNIYFGG